MLQSFTKCPRIWPKDIVTQHHLQVLYVVSIAYYAEGDRGGRAGPVEVSEVKEMMKRNNNEEEEEEQSREYGIQID